MKLNKLQKVRSLSIWGAKALIVTFLLLTGMGCKGGENTGTQVEQPTTTEVTTCSSTMTSTDTTSTTSSTTTNISTTTTTTTAQTTLMIQPVTQSQTIAVVTDAYVAPVAEYIEPVYNNSGYSDDDVVLLAKLINHEASNSYDGKVMVGSCVVNRMNAKGMSVSGVIFEPGQFTTAYSLSTYNDLDYQAATQVLSQGSADSRIYFFDGCHGDGLNWFYDINRNYLGAW